MATTKMVQAITPEQSAGVRPPAQISGLRTDLMHPMVGGSIDSVRAEIDDAYADMRLFHQREPDEVMRFCSGHSARLSELRVRIQRVEDMNREWRPIREREIEPTLSELERQYMIASRLHSVRELDWKMSQGER